jgi:hypothetical protein
MASGRMRRHAGDLADSMANQELDKDALSRNNHVGTARQQALGGGGEIGHDRRRIAIRSRERRLVERRVIATSRTREAGRCLSTATFVIHCTAGALQMSATQLPSEQPTTSPLTVSETTEISTADRIFAQERLAERTDDEGIVSLSLGGDGIIDDPAQNPVIGIRIAQYRRRRGAAVCARGKPVHNDVASSLRISAVWASRARL